MAWAWLEPRRAEGWTGWSRPGSSRSRDGTIQPPAGISLARPRKNFSWLVFHVERGLGLVLSEDWVGDRGRERGWSWRGAGLVLASGMGDTGNGNGRGQPTHGYYSMQEIIRDTLPEDERAAWDGAGVPLGTSPALEEVFRELAVIRYRVHRWIMDTRGDGRSQKKGKLAHLKNQIYLLDRPLAKLLRAMEVEARLREVEERGASQEAILAYLKSVPTDQLAVVMLQGELPRMDPHTGKLLLPTGQEGGHDGTTDGEWEHDRTVEAAAPSEVSEDEEAPTDDGGGTT